MLSRRDALRYSAGLALSGTLPRPLFAGESRPAVPPTSGAPGVSCKPTFDNIEGPYYRAGAPERDTLTEPGMLGVPLVIEGCVVGNDCGRGLHKVELEFWHATHDGHYDNDGTMGVRPERFLLRGRVRTDEKGGYRVQTIVPGRYLNGDQYRPAHVHVKLRVRGFSPLTTQLYFPGDPYNEIDPFIHRSLIMGITDTAAGKRARFDFVLRPA